MFIIKQISESILNIFIVYLYNYSCKLKFRLDYSHTPPPTPFMKKKSLYFKNLKNASIRYDQSNIEKRSYKMMDWTGRHL